MSDHKHEHGEACGCGHDHDHEHEEFVLTLTNEQGEDVEMVLVETFDIGEKLYALLLERKILKRMALFCVWKKKTKKWYCTISKMKKNGKLLKKLTTICLLSKNRF